MADPLAILGLVLAIPGIVDLGFQYISEIRQRAHEYEKASTIDKNTHVRINQYLEEAHLQFKLILQVERRGFERSYLQDVQQHLNGIAQGLREVSERLTKLKGKNAVLVVLRRTRQELDNSISQLRDRLVDSSRLIILIAKYHKLGASFTDALSVTKDKNVPTYRILRKLAGVNAPNAQKKSRHLKPLLEKRSPLPLSDVSIISGKAVVERKPWDCTTGETRERELAGMADLAEILHTCDPEWMGLLQCRGFVANRESKCFEIVYDYPPSAHPRRPPDSLRCLLHFGSDGTRHPLDQRIRLAKSLASAVLFVHVSRLVHKNIRPENILIFDDSNATEAYPKYIGNPYLIGFDKARPDNSQTVYDRADPREWQINMYRHPQRQGSRTVEKHNMLHDVYSLGVVLLEVGLWRSFVGSFDAKSGCFKQGMALNLQNKDARGRKTMKSPLEIKTVLVRTATRALPLIMGQRYGDIVVRCLECLDNVERAWAGVGLTDENGLAMGMKYIEEVMDQLEKIVI